VITFTNTKGLWLHALSYWFHCATRTGGDMHDQSKGSLTYSELFMFSETRCCASNRFLWQQEKPFLKVHSTG